MGELFSKLGIDWRLLIAQIINFLILLAILYKFLYKPVLGMLSKRTKTIEDSLRKAEKIDADFKAAQKEQEKILASARRDSQEIIKTAKEQAEAVKKDLVEQSKKEISLAGDRAKQDIEAMKKKALDSVKSEVGGLVVDAVRKIIDERMDGKIDEKYVEKILKD